ncbi:docking protein 3 [Osmerus mordax]|uniref:docking protein 3 n=1 Tax=Osmerus mordax TaxID=8014 RepID=UPI00350E992B
MEVAFKEGVLYLQGVKFGKKTWRKTWAMLFQPSMSGVGRVELYNMRDGPTSLYAKSPLSRRPEKRVRLCDCLSITLAQEEICPPDCSAFLLSTTQRCYTLASDACQDWVCTFSQVAFQAPDSLKSRSWREEKEPSEPETRVLQTLGEIPMEDNELYSSWKTAQYTVTIQPTEASRRCKLAGDYLLCPVTDGLLLLELYTAQTIYSWPYHLLRRFGLFKGGFSIEAGRRCSSGEGQFSFLSQLGPQIHWAVEEAIAQHRQEEDTKPPPWTSLPPSEAPTSGCYRDSSHLQSDCPDRLTGAQQPPRSSPTGCLLPEEESDECDGQLYATIDDSSGASCKHPAPMRMLSLPEASLESGGDEEDSERCYSLDAIRLDNLNGESDYYNLRTWVEGQGVTEKDSSKMEGRYAIVSKPQSQCQSQTHFQGQLLLQPQPNYYQPKSHPQLELRSPIRTKPQRTHPKPQPRALSQPRHQSPVQVEEEAEERGEGRARHVSPNINPTEIPGSFKQRLSDILSKDLAKFQPALPSGE